MNNQDVIDYVMNTPHNTNPTILKQKLNEQDFENRSDWNQNDPTAPDYVKNRPFYEETTYSNTLEWDGDTTGLLEDASGSGYWLVSDCVPTIEQLAGATFIYVENGEEKSVVGEPSGGSGIITLASSGHVVIATNGDEWWSGDPFAVGKGIYFQNIDNVVVKSLTLPNYQFPKTTLKTLDSKYLPEPDMVITISHGLRTDIHAEDVSITSGFVEGVSEKLWGGVPVDIRVRGFEVDGSYMAQAAEVKATGYYYNGNLFVEWLFPCSTTVLFRAIKFDMDGGVISTTNKQATMT